MNKTKDISELEYKTLMDIAMERARNNYFDFLCLLFPTKVKWNWHHRYICGVLQDFILTDKHNFLMLFMPSQHQKTTMMCEYLPPFAFGHNPNLSILLWMYNDTQARKQNRAVQKIIESPLYKEVFKNVRLNSKNVAFDSKGRYEKNSKRFEIVNHTGSFMSAGVGGGLAGNPVKLGLIDDIIKNQLQANSETYRENIATLWDSELDQRLHNDSKVAFTITRRHQDDLAGRLLKEEGVIEEGGKWKVIKLEALREDMSNEHDPREFGEAIFPHLHSRERLEARRDKNKTLFNVIGQQNTTFKGGSAIKLKWFETYDVPLPNEYFILDTAQTDNAKSDYSAGLKIAYRDNCIYINEAIRIKAKPEDLNKWVAGNMEDIQRKGFVENKSSGHSVKDYITKRTQHNMSLYKQIPWSKKARIADDADELSSGRVLIYKHMANYNLLMSELEAFPTGAHDHWVDCLDMAIRIFLKKSEELSDVEYL